MSTKFIASSVDSSRARKIVEEFTSKKKDALNLAALNDHESMHLREIFQVLTLDNRLKILILTGTKLTKKTSDGFAPIQALANMLAMNKTLIHLNLDHTDLGDNEATLLTEALQKRNVPLHTLSFFGNNIRLELELKLNSYCIPPQHSGRELSRSTNAILPGSKKLEVGVKLLKEKVASLQLSIEKQNKTIEDQQNTIRELQAQKVKEQMQVNGAQKKKGIIGKLGSSKNQKTIKIKNVRIKEPIGIGGSGASVFSASVDGWGCCMKELNVENVCQEVVETFEHEIEMLEQLPANKNICKYLFHIRKGNKVQLFMSKYSCCLRDIIAKKKEEGKSTFSVGEVSKMAFDIVNGLQTLHKHKFMHRDLKSDNIFVDLDSRGQVQLLIIGDFDTAKKISRKNTAKTILGTPAFMAPEVFSSKALGGYDYAADIWSFGMVLYELLSLERPYAEHSRLDVPDIISKGQRPLQGLNELSKEYAPLIKIYLECTSLGPEARPSATTLQDHLIELVSQYRGGTDA